MPKGKYFAIRSKLNGLCLDVEGGRGDPGTKVITWPHNGNDNQLWYVDHRTGTLRTKLNGMCLDLSGNRARINKLQPGDSNQQWVIKGEHICNRLENGKVMDIVSNNSSSGAELCGWDNHGGDNQKWAFEHTSTKFFVIVSKMHGKVFDVARNNKSPGANIIMYERKDTPSDNQLWYENKHGIIASKLNDLVMDGSDGQLVTAEFSKDVHRQWWLIDGDKIMNRFDNDLVLDIKGGSKSDSAAVIPWKLHGNENQLWTFEYV